MPPRFWSSRRRFTAYRARLKQRRLGQRDPVTGPATESAGHGRGDHASASLGGRKRSFWHLFTGFIRQLRGHYGVVAASLGASAVATLLGLIPLYGTKIVFDNVLDDKPLRYSLPGWVVDRMGQTDKPTLLWIVAGIMVILAILSLLIGLWSRWQMTRISKRVQVSMRAKVFDHAVRLPLHRVYGLKSGGVSSILREDAGAVGELVFGVLHNPWKAIIQLAGSLVILTFTDWRLLLGSLVIFPVVYYTERTWIGRIRPMYRDVRITRTTTDSHATEAFGGIRVVRGFSRQRSESQRFVSNNNLMARQELLVWWWSRGIDVAWSIIIPVASAGLLLYGGLRILHDHQLVAAGTMASQAAFTTGDLVMFLAYLGWLLNPLAMIANSATQLQNGLSGLDRALDLLDEPIEMPSRPGAVMVQPQQVAGRLTLENVSYRYPGATEPVLREINLEVQAGQMVALVGPSGAGKTTLTNLIARFFEPTRGAILLDGRDLRDIQLDSYRRLLGIVEQDIFLFDGTIADNIGYGRRGATRDQIITAATQANAHEFIMPMAHGYDTFIGERGVKLSGGQRQRLAIARAILADPRILILDEATSNLDTQSERLIQASMETLMAGRTCFVIAHRLSTIAHADRIVVIEHGRIAEQGRHEELMARSGHYRQMVELQVQPPAPISARQRELEPAGDLEA